jgi:CubicO group peptidase (beta-lactamase class C family)
MDQIHQFEQGLRPFKQRAHPHADHHVMNRMQYYGVPGISIALINDGVLAWARGYGVRDTATATPITLNTRFPVASITKPIVGLAVLRLVQQGVLDLDADVNDYLASWTVPNSSHTQQSKVTLRGLLSHSAGTTTFGFWGYRPEYPLPTLLSVLDGRPPANSVPVRVATLPGSQWRYSSGGYCIIQQLLVDVLHQPFPALMADLIFAPLAMHASTFAPTPPPDQWPISAHGHDATGAPIAERWRAHPELAAMGLWSTPGDITKLVIAVQCSYTGSANAFLAPELTRTMLTPQISKWGLGPAIDGTGATARFAHGGAVLGFRSYMVAYCERGQGAVITANGERGDHLSVELLHSIARAYHWPDYYHYLDNE